MNKLVLYLDSSIFGYAANEKAGEKYTNANILLKQINDGKFEAYASDVTIKEIEQSPNWIKDKVKEKFNNTNLSIISIDSEVIELARKYTGNKIIPKEKLDDACHIAIATINQLDAVVSYNYHHMVRLDVKLGVNRTNKANNYLEVDICSPEEVII
jgi:predicted nucleic acid-binding protein